MDRARTGMTWSRRSIRARAPPASGSRVSPGPPRRTRERGAGGGRGLRADPNPAAGFARLEFSAVHGQGRIEVLDAGGRKIWGRPLGPGSSTLVWDGSRDSGGGVAPAGLYFARAEDLGG